jgi:hypothetical protein
MMIDMMVIPDDHVETLDELIDRMAEAISPYAFGGQSSETEKVFAREAAKRSLYVCAPIILTEAAASLVTEDKRNSEAVEIIMGLRHIFK